MELYVEELKKIIETMSYTDNVAEFMGSVTELGAVDLEDLEAVAPEAIKQVRSRPNSPFASRESSPVRIAEIATAVAGAASATTVLSNASIEQMLHSKGYHPQEYVASNGHSSAAEYSDDEYIDTVEEVSFNDDNCVSYRTGFDVCFSLSGRYDTAQRTTSSSILTFDQPTDGQLPNRSEPF